MASEKTVLDPVFVVNGRKRGLPWILHALEDGRRLQFDHLRPHQEHAWHLFLVQTAAMLGPTDDWEACLRAEGDIWDVHPDPGECGFFQPAGRIEDGYKKQTYLEKEDIPGISTNHRAKAHLPTALDHWLYVLIAAQTISRHYTHHRQSIRTSGGYGDRPYISKVKGLSWPERFQSDVSLARSMHGDKEGIRFLWAELEKIDFFGDESRISFTDCHPLVVDSCRPYRMKDGVLYYKAGWPNEPLTTDIGDLHDRLDDPWLPIDTTDDHTTKRTQRSGFTYRVVQKYLAGGDIKTPSLQRELGEDCYFIGQTIAGGEGASQGIHHRTVKLPADLSDDLFPSDDTFASRSEQYVDVAATVKKRLLTFPLVALFGHTNDDDDDSDVPLITRMMRNENLKVTPSYSEYLNRYESRVDREFFPHLFDHAEEETGVEQWKNHLCDTAEELFEDALATCPNWERKAGADTLFNSRISDLRTHELEPSSVSN